jgi:hypothetical protein
MSDKNSRPELPDHLSIDAKSPFYNAAIFEFEIGIRFNGKERKDVEEYCISESWIKVPAGKALDRKGNPLLPINNQGISHAHPRLDPRATESTQRAG